MALPLIFDFYNSIIRVPAPDTTLDLQFLINQIRDVEDDLNQGVHYPKIADASGKDDLGGGVYTAITVRLRDNWRVQFEGRSGPDTTQCIIAGGNLVGGPGGNSVAPSSYVQVIVQSSAAGVIAQPNTSDENTNIKYLLATMRENQRSLGAIYYWDPVLGNDSNTGLNPQASVETFARAQTLVTTGGNDTIFCLASDPSGTTNVSESIQITKNNLKLRGPGSIFQFQPSSTTTPTIDISAHNVEVSGVSVFSAAGSGASAVAISGNNAYLKDCWIKQAGKHGVVISGSSLSVITTSVIESSGQSGAGNGIHLDDGTTQTVISKCIIFDNSSGVELSGVGIEDNVIENNLIYNHTQYGVSIGNGVNRTTVRSGNSFNKNTAGNVLDLGTDTYVETQAGGASASEIADAVWDEVIASHSGVGSAGKVLRDTKIKATLASLK
jgi:hypothetical protein